jgi:ADP-Ribosyltransferase in polyvalent proteins
MNIKEIRQKYPQYNDMSDTEFADAFHGRYYSDIPKEDFYKQLGIQTNQRQHYHDPVYGDIPRKSTVWEDIKQGAGSAANLVDLAASSLYAFPQSNENVRQIMDDYERRAKVRQEELGLPSGVQQGIGGKLISGVVGLPTAPLSGAQTAKTFKENGESSGRAVTAGVTDSLLQGVGMLIPGLPQASLPLRVGVGAGSNSLQEAISKKIIQDLATKEKTKKQFEATPEDVLTAGLTGGIFGTLHKGETPPATNKPSKLDTLRQIAPVEQPKAPVEPQQLELPLETSAQSIHEMQTKSSPQLDLFDPANQPNRLALQGEPDRQAAAAYDQSVSQIGRMNEDPYAQGHLDFNDFGNNDPMARMPNMRVDENGIPIRADISMEAQNLENPLQMNMWGDELGPALDQTRSLTEAIDTMPPGEARDTAIANVSGVAPGFGTGRYSSQRGAIDPRLFEDLYKFGKSLVRNAEGALMPLYHGSTNEINDDIRPSREGGALGNGVYLAVRPEYASGYAEGTGGNVHQVYANIANPLKIDGPGDPMVRALETLGMSRDKAINLVEKAYDKKGYVTTEVQNLARKQGYDGIFQYRNGKLSEIVAFDKDQVKNAISPESSKPQKQSKPTKTMTEDEITGGWEEDTPSTPPSYNRFGQGGSQTILNDLGLGVVNTVKAGYSAARDLLGKVTSDEHISGKSIPTDIPAEKIIQMAEGTKDTNAYNALEAGGNMRAYKGRAPWVAATSEIIGNALKRADLNIRNYVTGHTGAEYAARKLSKSEQAELFDLMKDEMFRGAQYTEQQMRDAGYTSKQLAAYSKLREAQKAALEAVNYGRRLQGKPEVTEHEAYLSSVWHGEIKMPVMDKNGKVVYYLAGNSERDVRNQFAALQQDNQGYIAGDIKKVRQLANRGNVEQAYSIMADAIGRDNPEFKKIQDWYAANQAEKVHGSLGMPKHFEDKTNVRGFVGDRPGMDPVEESRAGLQAQMDYVKDSFKWASLQDAANKMSPVFNDPTIRANHPNNLAYLQEQLRIATGANDHAISTAVNDGIRALGFTPAQVFGGTQAAKSWFMTQKLAVNLGYGAANLVQLAFTMPHLADMMHKNGMFNPLRSLGVASTLFVPMAGAHYAKQLAGVDLFKGIPDEYFYKQMFEYAEANGITGRSIVDEAPLQAGAIGRAANLTTSSPEAVIRSFAFTLFSDALKQTGKLSHEEIFKEAERRTNVALGDFRETERAPIFSRLGNVGNILNTLQTYGINYYQQANYFLREAGKGNVAPIVLMMLAQYGVGGISGIPGVQDLEKGWEALKGILPDHVFAKVGSIDPRLWAYEHFGATAVDGVLSTATGISMNSRVGAPDAASMLTAPGGPIIDAAKQVGSVGALMSNFKDPTQQAETLSKVMPTGLTGLAETTFLRDQTSTQAGDKRMYYSTTDLHKQKGAYARTPEEESLRRYGFKTPSEVASRAMDWKQQSYSMELNKRKPSFVDDFFYAATNGDLAKVKQIDTDFTKLYGKSIMDRDMKRKIYQKYLTGVQRAQVNANKLGPEELIRLAKIKQVLDQYK